MAATPDEPTPSGARDAVVVWGFRRPLRRRHAGDRYCGIKADRPYAMVDFFGTPYSGALHVVERYRLLDYYAAREAEERVRENFALPAVEQGFARDPEYKGKGLQLELTVEDEVIFTTPWSATMTYRRPLSPLGQWPEIVCAENAVGYDRGEKAAVPNRG